VFDAYSLLLMVSGLLLILVGAVLPGQSTRSRVINLLVGAAFFGYGFYLEFLFSGGRYVVFYYAFVVPILLLIQTFKGRKAAKLAREQRAAQQATADRAAPAQGYTAAPYGAPATPRFGSPYPAAPAPQQIQQPTSQSQVTPQTGG
jgi:hypothetical protein